MPARPSKPTTLDLGITPLRPETRARIAALKRAQWRKVCDVVVADARLYSGNPEQCSALVEAAIDAEVGAAPKVLDRA